MPWIEKYRPDTIDDVLSHDNIRSSLRNFIKNKYFPHLLFYGPPGSGKTSTIMACVRELYGASLPFMVKELNASDDRGIETVRTIIKHFVMAQNVFHNGENIFKMVILDETDAMTSDAQSVLRKIVEKYSLTTRFCFICNYVQNIDEALRSRCTIFRFAPLDRKNIIIKINQVAALENIKVEKTGVDTLIRRSNGDMRKILNILQSTSMAYKNICELTINSILGCPDIIVINKILSILINDNVKDSYDKILEIKRTYALSLADILDEMQYIFSEHLMGNKTILKVNISQTNIMRILDKLRLIEHNLAINTLETIQISSLIGIFKTCIKN